jgi:dephospho-CoA kinase
MLKVALTGGIATGKSYVLQRFRARGVATLDADELAHGVTAAGTEASEAIAGRFGRDVLDSAGAVDRRKLAAIVFADASARRDLESIVHPAVYRAIAAGLRAMERLGDTPIAIVDIPLLHETGHQADFDCVIATLCPEPVQVARLVARGMSERDARQRIAAQMPADEKAARAHFLIRTDGTFEDTDRAVGETLRKLQECRRAGGQEGLRD